MLGLELRLHAGSRFVRRTALRLELEDARLDALHQRAVRRDERSIADRTVQERHTCDTSRSDLMVSTSRRATTVKLFRTERSQATYRASSGSKEIAYVCAVPVAVCS
jgi:hypothetical protein